jgi:maltose alpha-D-glucosyltransferase/alpha-amylase
MEQEYPDAVIVPEGVEPRIGEPLAFHAEFFLVIFPEHGSLFDNQGAGVSPFHEPWRPFFEAAGEGSTEVFLAAWERVREVDPDRPVILASADHDLSRLACGTRTQEQLRSAFAFLLTWGSVPSIYYGDEIGMRYLPGLPDVEGAICNPAYNRAGCRTPMQWDGGVNAGFSTAEADALYLPIDPDPERPNVADHLVDPASTLHLVRTLIALRREHPALGGRSSSEVVHGGYPLAYVRGGTHLVVVNPREDAASVDIDRMARAQLLLGEGARVDGSTVTIEGFGFGVWELRA